MEYADEVEQKHVRSKLLAAFPQIALIDRMYRLYMGLSLVSCCLEWSKDSANLGG